MAELATAEEATENLYTCMNCMGIFKSPVMHNCGHSVCSTCTKTNEAGEPICGECSEDVTSSVPNRRLEKIVANFSYRMKKLEMLKVQCSVLAEIDIA